MPTRSLTHRAAHPVETGIGAAAVGAAGGLAAGAFAGPIGAAAGAVVGAVAGGYGGKAVGEMIDPTTEDVWLAKISKLARMFAKATLSKDISQHIATGQKPSTITVPSHLIESKATWRATGRLARQTPPCAGGTCATPSKIRTTERPKSAARTTFPRYVTTTWKTDANSLISPRSN